MNFMKILKYGYFYYFVDINCQKDDDYFNISQGKKV